MVQATIKGVTGVAQVTVSPHPVIATAKDSVGFSTIANGPQPAAQQDAISNSGGSTLVGVTDTTTYGTGATNWLTVTLTSSTAPDTLSLAASNTGLAIGTYSATVLISGQKAANSPKTVKVTLQVGAGAADHIAVDSGKVHTATAAPAVSVHRTGIVRSLYTNARPLP